MRAIALALVAVLSACANAQKPQTGAHPAASAFVMTAAYKQQVAAVGHKLEAQDRANDAEDRARMARLIDARVLKTKDDAGGVAFLLQVRNKTHKAIRTLGEGFEIRDQSRRRIALLEVDDAHVPVAPGATATLWQHARYTRFGDETADILSAKGKPKNTTLRIIEIGFADGSTSGSDAE